MPMHRLPARRGKKRSSPLITGQVPGIRDCCGYILEGTDIDVTLHTCRILIDLDTHSEMYEAAMRDTLKRGESAGALHATIIPRRTCYTNPNFGGVSATAGLPMIVPGIAAGGRNHRADGRQICEGKHSPGHRAQFRCPINAVVS